MLLLWTSACNRAPDPIHVQGTVTYRGQAVPGGVVLIHPDGSKGNHGERGYAAIKHGKFDTRLNNGKGVVPGAVKFVVGPEETGPEEEPLFQPYQFETEVSPTNTTFDIKVPG